MEKPKLFQKFISETKKHLKSYMLVGVFGFLVLAVIGHFLSEYSSPELAAALCGPIMAGIMFVVIKKYLKMEGEKEPPSLLLP